MCEFLTAVASLVEEHRLQALRLQSLGRMGLVAPLHVESSQTRGQTGVRCFGRQILAHCAPREVQDFF